VVRALHPGYGKVTIGRVVAPRSAP
jgi:hypothetical protein